MNCVHCNNELHHYRWHEIELRLCQECYAEVFEEFLQNRDDRARNNLDNEVANSSKGAEQGSVRSWNSEEWDDSSAARMNPEESSEDSNCDGLSYRYPLYTIYEEDC